jgi:prephenate dehydrogenase
MRLTIVGTGLIGASLGMAARAHKGQGGVFVVGYDSRSDHARRALERGALDEVAPSLEAAVSRSDIVVVATPVDRIADTCERLAPALPETAIVTDVGSAKGEVVVRVDGLLGARFVGGHPMAGSERHGPEAADETLFEGASWILTPTAGTSSDAYRRVSELASLVGAVPVALDPDVHDALLARLSHLPQLAASALVEVAAGAGDGEALLGLAASGFRDVTRIAASDPDMWLAIVRANRQAVVEALEGLTSVLVRLRSDVSAERWDPVRALLERARRARVSVFTKPVYTGKPVALWMLVPDRPGVLAEVTTAAGEIGANIEDLRIVHSTEGGRGRLELVVAGEEPADILTGTLRALGYHVERGAPQ